MQPVGLLFGTKRLLLQLTAGSESVGLAAALRSRAHGV